MKIFGFFGGVLNFVGVLGLWDIARHSVELDRGFYHLPFKAVILPWYIAADLCVLMAFLGAVLLVASAD